LKEVPALQGGVSSGKWRKHGTSSKIQGRNYSRTRSYLMDSIREKQVVI